MNELTAVLNREYSEYGLQINASQVNVKEYAYDARNGQDTYIVTIDGNAVGFTDGPLHEQR